MAIKEFFDNSLFTDFRSARDLYGNSVRQALSFDVFGRKTMFQAIVLTKPIFLADVAEGEDTLFGYATRDVGKLTKFSFKGRIIESPSPHSYLPNPCNARASTAAEKSEIRRLVTLHTTFISSDDYTKSDNYLPEVGDIVMVELTKNVFSYNLQFGTFITVKDNRTNVPSDEHDSLDCESLKDAFRDIERTRTAGTLGRTGTGTLDSRSLGTAEDPGDIPYVITLDATGASKINQPDHPGSSWAGGSVTETYARLYLTKLRQDQRDAGVPEGELATGVDSTGLSIPLTTNSMCGSTRSARSGYAIKKCEMCEIVPGQSELLHPDFCVHVQKMIQDASAETYADNDKTFGRAGGSRTTELQIKARISYCCGETYEEVVKGNGDDSCKCGPNAAVPLNSNHERGLAVDLGGTLQQGGCAEGESSAQRLECCQHQSVAKCRNTDMYAWLLANVHNKSDYGNIKNYTRSRSEPPDALTTGGEPWHWSYNGG